VTVINKCLLGYDFIKLPVVYEVEILSQQLPLTECLAACNYLFLGGNQRTVPTNLSSTVRTSLCWN
jgi:hypothetical protein